MASVPPALTPAEVATELAARGLDAWTHAGDELRRGYRFESFAAAVAFIAALAPTCDEQDHHPTWSNTYDRLDVRLTTHAAGNRVTERDLELAAAMEAHRTGRLDG